MAAQIQELAGAFAPAADAAAEMIEDYGAARDRFVAAAQAAGLALESHEIAARGPRGEPLSIDVALAASPAGAAEAAVVFSSGLHGVEGPFGSAVQSRFLEALPRDSVLRRHAERVRLVLIHALNPFGFAHRRRWNEDGVDLNRNFFKAAKRYEGAHELYSALSPFVNPASPPRRPDIFLLVVAYMRLRYGMKALREAIPTGQYAYPEGLFYGGAAASETVRLLDAHLQRWIGGAAEVRHLDFHTGLGPWAAYKLIADLEPPETQDPAVKAQAARQAAERVAALAERYGAEAIDAPSTAGVSYPARGAFKAWVDARFPDVRYDLLTAEFGTYSGPKVLQALRAENRAWRFCARGGDADRAAREALVEAFTPRDPAWRRRVIDDGLSLCRAALRPT